MSLRRTLLVVLALGMATAGIGGAHAALTSTTENPGNSIATATVFPSTIFTSAWDINDYSNGSNTDRSPIWAFTDSRSYDFGGTYTSHDATKYGRFDFGSRMKAGAAVSSATLQVRLLVGDTSDDGCFWVNVRRRSDQTSLATYNNGGAGWCTNSLTGIDVSVSLPVLDTTDKVNDVTIRLEGWYEDSTNNTANDWYVDRVVLTATTATQTLDLYPDAFADATDGNATTTDKCQASQTGTGAEGPWGLITDADSACLYGNANWTTTSYSAGRYIDFVIPANSVPSGASIYRVTLTHAWRPLAANNTCYFIEARQGGAAISTHGSSGSPQACSSATGSNSTQTVQLTGVDTATEVNGLSVRLYYWAAASTMTRHDELELEIKYA